MLKNIPAVIYARYSSANQREESIEDQLRECHKFAERQGYNVIGQYCDFAISGRTDDRPEFLRMICDSEKKLFKAVIVYRLDRFARNRFDSVLYKSRLAQYKVNVVSATECIPEGSDGVLIEALHEALAQKYSDDLSQIIRRGLYGNAEHCKSNGPLPFGYKVNPTTRLVEIKAVTTTRHLHTVLKWDIQKQKTLYTICYVMNGTKEFIYTPTNVQKAVSPALFQKNFFSSQRYQAKAHSKA